MAKGAIITDDVKKLIAQVFLEHPGWRAKEIQAEVSHQVSKNGDGWPSLSVVEKLLVEIRKRYTEKTLESNLEKPWHLGLMQEYNIPPEVVPDILAVQDWCAEEHPEVPLFSSGALTIRQALWISRLHGLTRVVRAGMVKEKIKDSDSLQSWLWQWSKAYAQYEILCALSGTPFDTTRLDKAIWEGDAMPISASNAVDMIYPDTGIWETVIEISKKEGEK